MKITVDLFALDSSDTKTFKQLLKSRDLNQIAIDSFEWDKVEERYYLHLFDSKNPSSLKIPIIGLDLNSIHLYKNTDNG